MIGTSLRAPLFFCKVFIIFGNFAGYELMELKQPALFKHAPCGGLVDLVVVSTI